VGGDFFFLAAAFVNFFYGVSEKGRTGMGRQDLFFGSLAEVGTGRSRRGRWVPPTGRTTGKKTQKRRWAKKKGRWAGLVFPAFPGKKIWRGGAGVFRGPHFFLQAGGAGRAGPPQGGGQIVGEFFSGIFFLMGFKILAGPSWGLEKRCRFPAGGDGGGRFAGQ